MDRSNEASFEGAIAARIDLSPGVPDLATFPRAAWLRAERSLLADLVSSAPGYGDPRGSPALRGAAANRLARNRGILADPADVIITSGTAQALGLFAEVLAGTGIREVAVEDRRAARDGRTGCPAHAGASVPDRGGAQRRSAP
ncbi:aminotransferase class I/II-fold pyridoxal phosphate-dependent enzyme [Actinomadura chokoriensis]|uniref:Aminotransferase class I/classII large domain-containing protein n=1 Tax=Actinomadura chokoriensis TaxID=454156 RepID=A0ABV4QU58_9ACTN